MNENRFKYADAVRSALSGDEKAFAFLYSKTYNEKLYLAKRYMKTQEAAEDVLQESYVKAWKNLDRLSDPEKFSSWLGMIVANTAKDALKAKQPMLFSDMEEENEDGDSYMMDIPDENPESQPENAFLEKERSALLKSLTDSLTDEQNMAITMFYIEQHSVKEIAEVMGCSENTVKSRLNYGRKNLKAKVDELRKKGWPIFGIAAVPLFLSLTAQEARAEGLEFSAFSSIYRNAGARASETAAKISMSESIAEGTQGAAVSSAAVKAGTAAAAGKTAFLSTMAGRILLIAGIAAAGAGIGIGVSSAIGSGTHNETAVQSSVPDEFQIKTVTVHEDYETTAADATETSQQNTTPVRETPVPASTPEATQEPVQDASAKILSDAELEQYLINNISKKDFQLVLGLLPSVSPDVQADTSLIKLLTTQINVNYEDYDIQYMVPSVVAGTEYDISLSDYNRYLALISEVVLTPDNMLDYVAGGLPPYQSGNEWYFRWYSIDIYPNGRSYITQAVMDSKEDRILVYYDFTDYVSGDASNYTEASPVPLVAELKPVNGTSEYRITSIHSMSSTYQSILDEASETSRYDNTPSSGTAAAVSADDSWKEAFLSLIGELGDENRYALAYIDEDDIPELAVEYLDPEMTRYSNLDASVLRLYKAVDGQAVQFYEAGMSKFNFLTSYVPKKNILIMHSELDNQGKSTAQIAHVSADGSLIRDPDIYASLFDSDERFKNDAPISRSEYETALYYTESVNLYNDLSFSSMPDEIKN